MEFQIERLAPEQWEILRDIRLKALSDTPNAFGSTLEKEREYSEVDWRLRLERNNCATFVAFTDDKKAIGLIVSAPYGHELGIFAMWVDSTERRKGVGGRLIDAVIQWAKEKGGEKLRLDVADENLSAIKLYESKGFQRTGVTGTLPPPRDHLTEHERCLILNEAWK